VAGLRGSSSSFKVVPQLITTILSGAQTGADRSALDWAIFHNIPHGGWCPKGREAEDGVDPGAIQTHRDALSVLPAGAPDRTSRAGRMGAIGR
jgi:hypothetical protein